MSVTPIPVPLRWEVWVRDDFRCLCCGARMFLVIDHVRPEAHGGATVASNLQTLCQPCNSRKRDHITPYIEPGRSCGSLECWCTPPQMLEMAETLEEWMDKIEDEDPLAPTFTRQLVRIRDAAESMLERAGIRRD